MTKPAARTWFALLTLALIACGSSAKEQVSTLPGLSADASKLLNALCERLLDCTRDTPIFSTQSGCVESLMARYECEPRLANVQIPELGACVNGLASVSCPVFMAQETEPTVCIPALASLQHEVGYGRAEETCWSSRTGCVAGTSCQFGDPCGVCKPKQVAGDACEGFCEGELFCNDVGKCELTGVEGAACQDEEQCFPLVCSPEGKCARPEVGDDCSETQRCGNLLNCVAGKCELRLKVGEACNEALNDSPTCTYDAVCIDGRCEAIASCRAGKLGSACSTNAQCAPGLGCSSIEDRCLMLVAEGEPCTIEHIQCAEGLRCQVEAFEDGTCRAPSPNEPPPQACE